MSPRRKEKPLTPQEAVEAAKRELMPYWFGGEPMLAGVRQAGQAAVAYPLDSRLTERPWLFFFVDLSSPSTPEVLRFMREWALRYEAQRLAVLMIVQSRYGFMANPEWVSHWVVRHPHPFLVALDRDNLLAQAFHATEVPRILLMDQGKAVIAQGGRDWLKGAELKLQGFFRKLDPGLPLFQPLAEPAAMSNDLPAFELRLLNPAERVLTAAGNPQPLRVGGQWSRQGDYWLTQDPSATLAFHPPGAGVGLVGQTVPSGTGEAPAPAQIQVELALEPGKDTQPGDDLTLQGQQAGAFLADARDRCRGLASLAEPRLYRLFESLPPAKRDVTLRFLNADKQPVALHAIRFWG